MPAKKGQLPPRNQRRPAPRIKTPEGLSPKQQRFVAEYLIDQNATQAAIRAGYSAKTAGAIGYENLKKPHVFGAVAEGVRALLERPLSEAGWVVAEVRSIAFSDVRHLFDAHGRLLDVKDLPEAVAPAVRRLKETHRTTSSGESETRREMPTASLDSSVRRRRSPLL